MSGLFRKFLPFVVLFAAIAVTIVLWFFFREYQNQRISVIVQQSSFILQNNIYNNFENHARSLERMAGRWARHGGTPQAEWNADAQQYIKDFHGFQAVEWVDQSGHIRWSIPAADNEKSVNFDLTSQSDSRLMLDEAHNTRQTSVSRNYDSAQGGKDFRVSAPIYTSVEFGGYIIGTFRTQDFINESLPENLKESFTIELFENNQEIFQSSPIFPKGRAFAADKIVNFRQTPWTLRLTPRESLFIEQESLSDLLVLIVGTLVSLLLCWTTYLARKARRKTLQTAAVNDKLTKEINKRQSIQKYLQESSALQNAVLNGANYMIIATDPEGTIISFNTAAEKNLGYSAEDLIGKSSPAVFHDGNEVVQRAQELSTETGELIEPGFEVFVHQSRTELFEEREWTYIRQDGTRFPVSLSITAMRHEGGQLIGFLGVASDISAKKISTEKIRAAEERMRLFVENTPAAVAMLDREMRYMMTSERWKIEYNLGDQEIIGRSHYEVFPDLPESWKKIHQRGLRGETLKCEEDPFLRADGSVEWVRWEMFPWSDNHGEVAGIIFFTEVITERKRIQMELARTAAIVESTEDAIMSKNLDGVIQTWNRGAEITFGYQANEVIGNHVSILFPPELLSEEASFIKTIKSGKHIKQFETVRLKKGGESFPVSLTLSPIFNEKSEVIGVSKIARDITAQKNIEQTLRESEKRVRNLLEFSPVGIVLTDSEGGVVFVNDRWSKMTGLSTEQAKGSGWVKAVHRDDRERIFQQWTENALLEEEATYEFRFVTPAGVETEVIARALKQYDQNGAFTGHLATIADISEIRLMQTELEQARDSALVSARMKAEFLANMSHEIRTPMNGVIGMTELLLAGELSDSQRENAELVRSSADSLLTIINDILDFSKIEAGKLNFEIIDFNLTDTVENTIGLFTEQGVRKNIAIASHIEADVCTNLRGDPGRLRQILTNLIGNAVKFTDVGEVIIRVSQDFEEAGKCGLRFEIRDTGIGIETDSQKYLFQAFTQADGSMTRKFGGTGLGLTISKQLVELMNGEISVESEIGRGSTFAFTVILETPQAPIAEEFQPRKILEGLRVLVADQNSINRKVLIDSLKSWGIITEEAEDGMNALIKLREAAERNEYFDAAVLDLTMPSMSGFELADFIKGDLEISRTKLILTTSFGQREQTKTAQENGIDAFLIKPVRPAELFDCIASLTAASKENPHSQSSVEIKQERFLTRHVPPEDKKPTADTILIVEDNPVNQKVARMQVERLGYLTRIAENGLEAVNAVKHHDYSLILMDCQMPVMDGYEATAQIRRNQNDHGRVPIIAMTANAMQGEREKCLAAGMDDYLTKPVKSEQLARYINQWLGQSANAGAKDNLSAAAVEISDTADLLSLDHSILESFHDLQLPDEPDLVTDLIDLFINDSGKRIDLLVAAAEQGDRATVKSQAHNFKGSAGNIGAFRLAKLAKTMESNLDNAPMTIKIAGEMKAELLIVTEMLAGLRV